ncbi:MAG: carbamoyltransferase HypF, partial [Mariprofundales bacterium]|nr:carbamoyltransferase HypF [Mariprofundales bacterium]
DALPIFLLEDAAGNTLQIGSEQAIVKTATLLRQGYIVAIKGVGGIHLAVDASNHDAVVRLRERKGRFGKAFAMMAAGQSSIRDYAMLSAQESRLLTSPAAPIVLLTRLPNGRSLSKEVAPGSSRLGFMLPYSPLHHLLMMHMDVPIVLTSGNISDEPQSVSNSDARERLVEIADFLLLHNREIINRLDDSVVLVMHNKPRIVRRARGYAPAPLILHESFGRAAAILAMGGELKSSFCMLQGGQAMVSQHLGSMESPHARHEYCHTLTRYQQMWSFTPEVIAVDQHPDYFPTHLGKQMAVESAAELVVTQHHHAHIAAVLAEHRYPIDGGYLLGIALDGVGLGDDGSVWGGEFMLANYRSFTRLGSFQPVALPGGSRAVVEPWRNTFAHLHTAGWQRISSTFSDTDIVRLLSAKPLTTIQNMITKQLNSPMSSSCGRLFDAVAAALGICPHGIDYEGQAAIELETLAQRASQQRVAAYAYRLLSGGGVHSGSMTQISWQPMWLDLLRDLRGGVDRAVVAARFHRTVGAAVVELARVICRCHQLRSVVLCGGSFQNSMLLEIVAADLEQSGYEVLIAQQLPVNDGGLAVGQAAIAAAIAASIECR